MLLVISLLLGGCGAVHAELHFHGPGRLQVGQRLERGPTAVATPWEQGLLQALQQAGLRPDGASEPGHDHLQGATMPAVQALELLAANLGDAARLAGVELPAPELLWQERNWLVGVQQRLTVAVDLRGADPGAWRWRSAWIWCPCRRGLRGDPPEPVQVLGAGPARPGRALAPAPR